MTEHRRAASIINHINLEPKADFSCTRDTKSISALQSGSVPLLISLEMGIYWRKYGRDPRACRPPLPTHVVKFHRVAATAARLHLIKFHKERPHRSPLNLCFVPAPASLPCSLCGFHANHGRIHTIFPKISEHEFLT